MSVWIRAKESRQAKIMSHVLRMGADLPPMIRAELAAQQALRCLEGRSLEEERAAQRAARIAVRTGRLPGGQPAGEEEHRSRISVAVRALPAQVEERREEHELADYYPEVGERRGIVVFASFGVAPIH